MGFGFGGSFVRFLLLGVEFANEFDEEVVELFEAFVGHDVVFAGVVVDDFAVGADDDPDGELSSGPAGVAEFAKQGGGVERDRVAEVHEFAKLADGAFGLGAGFGLLGLGVNRDAIDLNAETFTAVVEIVEETDLSVRFAKRFSAVVPDMEEGDLSGGFEQVRLGGYAVDKAELERRCLCADKFFGDDFEIAAALALAFEVASDGGDELGEAGAGGLFVEFGCDGRLGLFQLFGGEVGGGVIVSAIEGFLNLQ